MNSNESSDPNVPASLVLAINFFTIAIFMTFLLKFTRIQEKTYTHYFLLILSLSDLLYPIVNTFTVYSFTYNDRILNARLFGPLVLAIYAFNMHWSAAFAVYTYQLYRSIQLFKIFNYNKFMTTAVLSSFFLSFFFPIISYCQNWGERMHYKIHGLYSIGYSPKTFFDQSISFTAFGLIGIVLPITLIVIYFYKVNLLIKSSSLSFANKSTSNFSIWWYPCIAVICFIPGLLCDVVIGLSGQFYPTWLSIVSNLLHRAWAFVNLWVYWRLTATPNQTSEDALDESLKSANTISSCKSNSNNSTDSKHTAIHFTRSSPSHLPKVERY